MLNDILRNAFAAKASDIHINVGLPPLFRIHTVVTHSDFPIVTPEGSMRLAKEIMNNESAWAAFEAATATSRTRSRAWAVSA
jgi:twitching motility protein PilT